MMSAMRFPHCLTRGAANSSRRLAAIVQSHDVSTSTTLPSHNGRNCIKLGNRFAKNYRDVGFNNYVQIERNNFNGGFLNQVRAFSSTDADGSVDDDAAAANQQIISLAESGDISKAEELLSQMQADAVSQNQKDGLPDIDSYTALMNACIEEQRRLISDIEDETNEIKSDGNATMPNEHCVELIEQETVTVMSLAEKTHDLLIQMEDFSGVSDHYSSMRLSGGGIATELRDETLRPTSHHYDSVISAFANATIAAHDTHYSNHLIKNSPFWAQRWLERMETLAFDPHSGVSPTVDSYFHVMEAMANGEAIVPNKKQSKAPILVQTIFDKLKQNTNICPTVREYRLLLHTWCGNSGIREAAFKAMGVWMTMQKSFREGDEEMEPTLEDGKMLLEAWTRSINKHSARRAQTILSTMDNLHAHKKTDVKPDLDCYRYVLSTMSRSRVPWIGSTIPKLFKSMEDNEIFADTACFDAAIETLKNCARHSKEEDSEKYAMATENMLQMMEKETDRSSVSIVKPSAVTYTNVIQALAARKTKKAAETADKLLTKMITEYAANGDESMRPMRNSYVGTIHAYGNSGMESNYTHANEVLQRMMTDYSENGNENARPDVSTFHAVIRACARAKENSSSSPEQHKEALLLAISTVQHMKKSESTQPNSLSYVNLLRCCKSLLPRGPERERAIRSIFRSCCKDGLANAKVLSEFQSSVSNDVYHTEVVRDAPSYNGIKCLPKTWTRSLGYRVREYNNETTLSGDGGGDNGISGIGKRNPIISVNGQAIESTAYNEHRMRKRWSKKNQKLLQGGRITREQFGMVAN